LKNDLARHLRPLFLTMVGMAALAPFAAGADAPSASAPAASEALEARSDASAEDASTSKTDTDLEPKPEATWSVGVGPGVVNFPDYVGSDERRTLVLPIPFINYESRHLRVRRGVLQGVFDITDRARIDLSLGGTLPVRSSDNKAREGMPDLLTTIEIGPSLEYDLWGGEDAPNRLRAILPVRSALGVNLSRVENVGWVTNPSLEYRRNEPLAGGQARFLLSTGPLFNSERYNSTFYQVRERDARPGRPAYDANGGYGGWRVSGSVGWRWGDVWVGAFARYIDLHGTAFENSPLVKTHHYLMGGLGTAWIFASSDDEGGSE